LEVTLDLLYAPWWLRLIIGHGPMTPAVVDHVLTQAWPGRGGRTMTNGSD